jgi:hypothetical protein
MSSIWGVTLFSILWIVVIVCPIAIQCANKMLVLFNELMAVVVCWICTSLWYELMCSASYLCQKFSTQISMCKSYNLLAEISEHSLIGNTIQLRETLLDW